MMKYLLLILVAILLVLYFFIKSFRKEWIENNYNNIFDSGDKLLLLIFLVIYFAQIAIIHYWTTRGIIENVWINLCVQSIIFSLIPIGSLVTIKLFKKHVIIKKSINHIVLLISILEMSIIMTIPSIEGFIVPVKLISNAAYVTLPSYAAYHLSKIRIIENKED